MKSKIIFAKIEIVHSQTGVRKFAHTGRSFKIMTKDLMRTRQTWLEQPSHTLFGIWLRKQRHKLDVTQTSFAAQAKIAWQSQSDYELGIRHPGEANAKKLAEFLGIGIEEIIEQVRVSTEYLNNHGEEGIINLLKQQPRATPPNRQVAKFRAKRGKANRNLRDSRLPTGFVKVTVPIEVELQVREMARIRDKSVSEMLGELVMNWVKNNAA